MVTTISRLEKERDQLYPNILTAQDEQRYCSLYSLIESLRGVNGDLKPISIAEGQLKVLRKIIERGLNENQLLILKELASNGHYLTVTNFLDSLSKKYGIPESTLRWNVDVLKELRLITQKNGDPIRLSNSGRLIVKILGDEKQ